MNKYSSDGTLMCIICNSPIKSESLWPAHINAKQHRDNIAKKKPQKEVQHTASVAPLTPRITKKEPTPVPLPTQPVKIKGMSVSMFFK